MTFATVDHTPQEIGWRMTVLPFRSIDAAAGAALTLGMAEEISTILSHLRAPLMASVTFWDGSGPTADAFARSRSYQLDYVLDGTIEVSGEHVHLKVALLDVVLDFEPVWAADFEGDLNDLFSLERQIATETIAQIDPELIRRTSLRESSGTTKVAAAHHAVLTAIQGIFEPDRQAFMRARELLTEAIDLDPAYAAAHAWLAYWGIMAVGQGWVEGPQDVMALAGSAAERAVQLDPGDARALAIAGHVKAYLMHDVQGALRLHSLATKLNPNLPIAWTLSSLSRMYNGEHATAIRHASTALSLSPREPHIFLAEQALMTARFFLRQLEEAEMLAEMVLTRLPGHVSALNVQLAILGHLGHREEARQTLAALRKILPNVSVETIVARAPLRPGDRAYYIDGLLRAGVPRSTGSGP